MDSCMVVPAALRYADAELRCLFHLDRWSVFYANRRSRERCSHRYGSGDSEMVAKTGYGVDQHSD